MRSKVFNHRRGLCRAFTMMEITIVLGVIAVLSAALWTTLNKVMANHRLGQATEQINTLVGKMRDLYTGQSAAILSDAAAGLTAANGPCTNFNTVGRCNISQVLGNKQNFYSPEIVRVVGANRLPFNPWGGRYELWFVRPAAQRTADFIVAIFGLNSQSCADLISRVQTVGTNNGTNPGPPPTVATTPSLVTDPVLTGVGAVQAASRVGNLQNGLALNVFFNSGAQWYDVTALTPDQIAQFDNFETCNSLAFYYLL